MSGSGLFIGNGVAAHRGNMSVKPENTMEAFESAAETGCDWLELDIQRTADGHLVVTHDAYTLRTCGVDLPVAGTTLSALRELNFGAYMQDGRQYRVPLLSEVFEFCRQHQMHLTVQPKCGGVVEPAIRLAKEMNVLPLLAFNELNCEYLAEVKLINRDIPVFWDRLPGTNVDVDIHMARTFGFETLMYVYDDFTRETADKVRNAGLECGVCVVNDGAEMDKYLSWGIRMFYTDYPELLMRKI